MHPAILGLTFLLAAPAIAQAQPQVSGLAVCGNDASWTYMPVSGRCYRRVGDVYRPVTKATALDQCLTIGGIPVRVDSQAKMLDLLNYCMRVLATGARIWTDAVKVTVGNSSQWIWQSTGAPVANEFWSATGRSGLGNCAYFVIDLSATTGYWTPNTGLYATNCLLNQTVICEKNATTSCSLSQLSGFDSRTMVLSNVSYSREFQNLLNPGVLSTAQCQPGFFRDTDSPIKKVAAPPTTPEGLKAYQAFCLANGTFLSNSISPCFPISCNASALKTDTPIPNVKPYASLLTFDFYNYSYTFSVNCQLGYVSYANSSSIIGNITCEQSSLDRTQGEWSPPDLNTCTAVKCVDINAMISDQSAPYKAVNRDEQKEYGAFQQSSYPFYPNLVHVKCRQEGFFYEDRQFEKLLRCDLANGSLITGQWYGAQGTDLKRLPLLQCMPVSCLSDGIISRVADAKTVIDDLLYMASATIYHSNGTNEKIAATAVNRPETYPFATLIAFECQNGTETGVGDPITNCKADGFWNVSKLPGCIKKSESLQLSGNQKHFVPPAKEAGNARSVGAVVIMIVVIFCVLVVVLDLSTLSRDISLLRTNLRRLKHFKMH